jgi:hypothetical protein
MLKKLNVSRDFCGFTLLQTEINRFFEILVWLREVNRSFFSIFLLFHGTDAARSLFSLFRETALNSFVKNLQRGRRHIYAAGQFLRKIKPVSDRKALS